MAVTGNQGATSPIGAYNYGNPVQGARATTDVQTARRIPQYTKTVRINANVTPLTAFMDKLKNEETVGGVQFFHIERDLIPLTITLDSAGYSSGATTLNVVTGTGAGIVAGSVLWCPRTNETILVTARATDALTVTRAFGTGAVSYTHLTLPTNREV